MKRIDVTLLAVAMLILGSSHAHAQEGESLIADEPSETTETFGAWTVRCRSGAEDARACEVVHAVRGQGGMLAQIAIGTPPGQEAMLIVVQTPLGVDVSEAVGIAGEDEERITLPFATCLQTGCIAQAETDADALQALAASEQARLAFVERTGRAIEVTVPLSGLTSALGRL